MKHIFLISVLCLLACVLHAQITKKNWDYPVKPGMEKWNQLKTEQERIAAVQVPMDILAEMTSEETVELFIKFPLFGYFTAFNTPQDGFSVMLTKFNIFQHLLSRKDTGKSLIALYKDAGMSGFGKLSYSNDFWTIKLNYIELILSQKDVLQSLTSDEKLELLSEARDKSSKKINNEDFSSLYGMQFSVRIIANILNMDEFQEFKLISNKQTTAHFIQTGVLGDVSLIEEILIIADSYINHKKQTK